MSNSGLAVVFGLAPNGLSTARSLAPHGVTVYGVDALWYEVGHFSKWIRHDPRISRLAPGPELLRGLLAFGKDCPVKPVVFASADAYIGFLAAHHEALAPYYVMPDSMRPEVNSVFVNKRTFYEACQKLGVVMPQTFFPRAEAEVRTAAKALRYPAIIKPSEGFKLRQVMRGQKLVEVATAEDLLRWWHVFQTWNADVVLQECIPGPEANLAVAGLYVNRSGECLSLFTARKCRQHPPMFGSGSYMEAKWLPEVAALSVDLIQKLHYHGVCGTEYKWDERDRQWKLIEVNVRSTLWFALTRAAGVDVVWDTYCDLVGRPNPVNLGRQDDTMRWQFFVRDLPAALHFLRAGELSWREFVRTALDQRRKEWAVCAWDDWGANWGYLLYTAMQIWTKFVAPVKSRSTHDQP